ncbi:Phosphatidylglycerol/phosphatidylinositol transfer protein [Zalerion maritima]|uniref:Phosphatidylglycerol/phosphatidylinositol transfer protein n=1 Tax=Zalerion maritima TaxID=339359 RepID=A0AAD5WQK9_9PEZI|nr:Phosphatidylglycerol/phosphatidylinositol transfer protein [Zalerion maritima]
MRVSTAVIAALAAIAPVSAQSIFSRKQDEVRIANDDLKIPGDSPLELCSSKEHDDDIIKIQKVDLVPNPPLAGETLVINAIGTVEKTIEEGAYVLLQVKYGLIRLISTKADLCEQISNVDMDCPVEKGVVSIVKTVDLPNEIPPGKYNVFADVYTKDDEPVTCLTASVTFGVHKAVGDYFNIEL